MGVWCEKGVMEGVATWISGGSCSLVPRLFEVCRRLFSLRDRCYIPYGASARTFGSTKKDVVIQFDLPSMVIPSRGSPECFVLWVIEGGESGGVCIHLYRDWACLYSDRLIGKESREFLEAALDVLRAALTEVLFE